LRVGNSSQVADMVRRREADLGFVEGPHAPHGLRSRAIGADELVVVVAPSHPWAVRRLPLPLRSLAATPLILREQGSGTRDALGEFLREAGEFASPAAELGSTTAIKSALTTGDAPAVLSRLAVSAELDDGRLINVPLEGLGPLRRTFRAVWLSDTPPAGPATTLLDLVLHA
jgi:DNA-binding transcriptional LysR family regulator